MKKYIKDAVRELLAGDKRVVELVLRSKSDYKKNFVRLLYNKFILTLQQKIVPCHLKNFILRTTGMKVGFDACIPHDISFDAFFPELIVLSKGCLVGGDSRIMAHEVKGNKLVLGKCVAEERTLLGGLSVVKPGSVVSRNSILNMYSELGGVIPEGELWGGTPAKQLMKFSAEDVDKFFRLSKKDMGYYKSFKKQVKEFMKDKSKNYFKVYYNGKRLNAGDDWWRARNIFRIWYNGVIIELTRLLPHSFFKTFLLRMAGVKIGKNVRIGKGCVFDHIYCDTITLEDGVVMDDYCYIDGHEYTITQTVFGKTLLKKGAHLKHHAYVRTAATIGENTTIESYSMAQRDIPANEVWEGVPAKFKRKK